MTDLAAAVVSVAPTQRRRFFWAAWWTGAPSHSPFRKPDASNGGARTREEALAEAERVAGRRLVLVEPWWAHAWNRVLRGEAPPPRPQPRAERPRASAPPERARGPARASPWAVLGVAPGATADEVKRAFRARAFETHPDRGGDHDAFLDVRRAYEQLAGKLTGARR